MTATLLIARHGNTFAPGETPRRAGARTDLPLVDKGRAQAQALGRWLAQWMTQAAHPPLRIVAGPLLRTRQTAEHIAAALPHRPRIEVDEAFCEIDYGPDEGQTEEAVLARIGPEALARWDRHAIAPAGWLVDPEALKAMWMRFAAARATEGGVTLVVTSNGIARFAPYLTGDFGAFAAAHPVKLATGAVGELAWDGARWRVERWNERPPPP